MAPAYDVSQYYAMSEELLNRDIWTAVRMKGVETIVRYGTVVDTILRESAEWRADLLVVGSHGKGWGTRLLMGSVTEGLLNQLPTSLLVVSARAAVVAEPGRIGEVGLRNPVTSLA
jgi:nucleotide-binding universal stress UspA family protein